MKSLVLHGEKDIRFDSVPDPVLTKKGSAIVRIRCCSICGSDLHPYTQGSLSVPYCIGHEAVGEIVETGSEVRDFKVGDRVILPGSLSCGKCPACRSGNVMLCENVGYPSTYGLGSPAVGGCQSEAVEVPSADNNLFRQPDGMRDEVALALTDTLPTAWAGARSGGVGAGSVVAVIGLGAIGLQTILAAFAQGAERIFAFDLVKERREAARVLGATVFDGDRASEELKDATDGRGVDIVVDANGSQATLTLALELVRKGGHVAVSGISENLSIQFPVAMAIGKSVTISYVICSVQAQIPDLLNALFSERLKEDDIASLFTHRMMLSNGPEAYRLFSSRQDGVKKILLEC